MSKQIYFDANMQSYRYLDRKGRILDEISLSSMHTTSRSSDSDCLPQVKLKLSRNYESNGFVPDVTN